MRTFYVFKIKKELTILTKETPYNLFRTIENMYYMDSYNLGVSFKIYNDIFDTFNKDYLNKRINNIFKNNRYYESDGDIHKITNKYRPENSTLRVYKSHLILKSDTHKPALLLNYLMSDNLFVCDFQNKDYFWLSEYALVNR